MTDNGAETSNIFATGLENLVTRKIAADAERILSRRKALGRQDVDSGFVQEEEPNPFFPHYHSDDPEFLQLINGQLPKNKPQYCSRYQAVQAERDRKAREKAEEEKKNDSDVSMEWTLEKCDAEKAEKARKRYTKSRRAREHRQFGALIAAANSKSDSDENPDRIPTWEDGDDFLAYVLPAEKTLPRYVSRFMELCYANTGSDCFVKVVSFRDGAFYCAWDSIEKQRLAFEDIVNDKETGIVRSYVDFLSVFPGDVIFARTGLDGKRWVRAIVHAVYKRAKQMDVVFLEDGARVARISKDDVNCSEHPRIFAASGARTFFVCRFELEGVAFSIGNHGLQQALERTFATPVAVRINCRKVKGRTCIGKMWLNKEGSWLDVVSVLTEKTTLDFSCS